MKRSPRCGLGLLFDISLHSKSSALRSEFLSDSKSARQWRKE